MQAVDRLIRAGDAYFGVEASPLPLVAERLPMPRDLADPIEPHFRRYKTGTLPVGLKLTPPVLYFDPKLGKPTPKFFKSTAIRVSDLEYLRGYRGENDAYVVQNNMKGARSGKNTLTIGACYVDLDFYSIRSLSDENPMDIAERALDILRDHAMPAPTYAVSSGRGVYLKWLIVPKSAEYHGTTAEAVNRKLIEVLKDLGADAKSYDKSRLLRICGSINSKTGRRVEIIDFSWSGNVYNLDTLAAAVDPALARKKPKREFKPRLVTEADKPRLGRRSIKNWNEGVIRDIRTLFEIRGGLAGAQAQGRRDLYAYLVASQIALCDPENVEQRARAFIEDMNLDDKQAQEFFGYCSTVFKRTERALSGERVEINGVSFDPRYTHSKDTLIKLLQISDDEAGRMVALVPDDVMRSRKQLAQTERRRAEGVAPRQDYLADRARARAGLVALVEAGLSAREIADRTGQPYERIKKAVQRLRRGPSPDSGVGTARIAAESATRTRSVPGDMSEPVTMRPLRGPPAKRDNDGAFYFAYGALQSGGEETQALADAQAQGFIPEAGSPAAAAFQRRKQRQGVKPADRADAEALASEASSVNPSPPRPVASVSDEPAVVRDDHQVNAGSPVTNLSSSPGEDLRGEATDGLPGPLDLN